MGAERYVREADVEPMMQLEIAEAVAVAVQSATDKLLDAVLTNLTRVATGEMRVVNPEPVVLPFKTTKDCWQWMTEQKERREQAETVAQIRLEHIRALMAERTEQDKLVQTQGREIVRLTDQVQRQKGMIKEGWDRINALSDELSVAQKAVADREERIDRLLKIGADLRAENMDLRKDILVAKQAAEKQADELAQARERLTAKQQTIDELVPAAQAEPPPVEHVHDQNEKARQRATDEIKCELSKAFPAQFPFYAGHCE